MILTTTLCSLSACQNPYDVDLTQMSPDERRGVESLIWLQHADAEQDTHDALSRNDKRLLIMTGRSPDLPGVAPELASKAKSICGVRYVKGSTDTVYGEMHLKMLQAASDYSAAYNRIMINYCMNNQTTSDQY
jgi:hypothetical protein